MAATTCTNIPQYRRVHVIGPTSHCSEFFRLMGRPISSKNSYQWYVEPMGSPSVGQNPRKQKNPATEKKPATITPADVTARRTKTPRPNLT